MNEEFNIVYKKYKDLLYNYICRKRINKIDAEDILQEVFIKFYNYWKKLEREDNLPLLYVIANQLIIDRSRTLYFKKQKLSFSIEEKQENIDSIFDIEELRESNLNCLIRLEENELAKNILKNSLSFEEQVIFELDYLDYENKEIAYLLNMPLGTMKVKLHRLKKKIRKYIIGNILN